MHDNDYLVHHGVKGMKWGVRRTDAQLGNNSNGSGTKTSNTKVRRTAADYKKMKKSVDTAKTYVESGKKAKKAYDSKKTNKQIKEDLSKMSDKELQQIVNRLNMEERYTAVMNSRQTASGKDRVIDMLDTAGTVLAVGSSVLSIMIAMKELQK